MIELGIGLHVKPSASPEPDNSREVRGMDPLHLHEWIMNVP